MRLGMDTGWTQYLANNAYWTGTAYNYVNTFGYGGVASRIAQVKAPKITKRKIAGQIKFT